MTIRGGPDIIEDGLVLHLDAADRNSYPGTGTAWYDMSGNQSTFGAYKGSYHNDAGSLSSFVFDGVDDNVGRSVPSSLQIHGDKTIETWFKHYSSGGDSSACLIRVGIGADLLYSLFSYRTNPNYIRFHWYNSSFRSVDSYSGAYSTNEWTHTAFAISGTTGSFYINGSLNRNVTVSTPSPTSAGSIGIGATRSGNAIGTTAQDLAGEISIMKVYNRALSADEILQNYNATKGRYGL